LRDVTQDDLEDPDVKERLSDVLHKRARHVITENIRTEKAYEFLQKNDYKMVGELMIASNLSLQFDYEVTCPEIDLLIELTQQHNEILGARMTGGGFGGCIIALVETAQAENVGNKIAKDYFERTQIMATVIISRPAGGARNIKQF